MVLSLQANVIWCHHHKLMLLLQRRPLRRPPPRRRTIVCEAPGITMTPPTPAPGPPPGPLWCAGTPGAQSGLLKHQTRYRGRECNTGHLWGTLIFGLPLSSIVE